MKGDTQCFPSGFSLCKVSFSLPVGTLSLCVIAVSRLSLCDVLLLLCPHMRSSISKETFLSSPRVSFYQSLHRCCLHASELRPIRRRVRQALRKEERDKESKKNFTCSLLVCFNGWKNVSGTVDKSWFSVRWMITLMCLPELLCSCALAIYSFTNCSVVGDVEDSS